MSSSASVATHVPVVIIAAPEVFVARFPYRIERRLIVFKERDDHPVADAFGNRIAGSFALGTVYEPGADRVGRDVPRFDSAPCAVKYSFPLRGAYFRLRVRYLQDGGRV